MIWNEQDKGRGSIARANFDRWSSICADLISEAERPSANGMSGGRYFQVLYRANAVLDDMDEALLASRVGREHPKFLEAALPHRRFEQCLQKIPTPLRASMRRGAEAQ